MRRADCCRWRTPARLGCGINLAVLVPGQGTLAAQRLPECSLDRSRAVERREQETAAAAPVGGMQSSLFSTGQALGIESKHKRQNFGSSTSRVLGPALDALDGGAPDLFCYEEMPPSLGGCFFCDLYYLNQPAVQRAQRKMRLTEKLLPGKTTIENGRIQACEAVFPLDASGFAVPSFGGGEAADSAAAALDAPAVVRAEAPGATVKCEVCDKTFSSRHGFHGHLSTSPNCKRAFQESERGDKIPTKKRGGGDCQAAFTNRPAMKKAAC